MPAIRTTLVMSSESCFGSEALAKTRTGLILHQARAISSSYRKTSSTNCRRLADRPNGIRTVVVSVTRTEECCGSPHIVPLKGLYHSQLMLFFGHWLIGGRQRCRQLLPVVSAAGRTAAEPLTTPHAAHQLPTSNYLVVPAQILPMCRLNHGVLRLT